jgi:hypothetical protein
LKPKAGVSNNPARMFPPCLCMVSLRSLRLFRAKFVIFSRFAKSSTLWQHFFPNTAQMWSSELMDAMHNNSNMSPGWRIFRSGESSLSEHICRDQATEEPLRCLAWAECDICPDYILILGDRVFADFITDCDLPCPHNSLPVWEILNWRKDINRISWGNWMTKPLDWARWSPAKNSPISGTFSNGLCGEA